MQSNSAQLEQEEPVNLALPLPNRDGYSTERTYWNALLVLPLVTYGLVTLLTFSIKPTPINTGDPLYDKFLGWVADELVENYIPFETHLFWNEWGSADHEPSLDPLAGWEAEFGDDPRYWLLRFWNSRGEGDGRFGYPEADIGHLERAWDLGIANGPILLILLAWPDDGLWKQYSYRVPSGTGMNLEQTIEMEKQTREKIDELRGAEHSQLLAELMEVAQEESLPHYYAALYCSQRGNYAEAIQHLAAGNRAPFNFGSVGLRMETHLPGMPWGASQKDKLVSGTILGKSMTVPRGNFNQFKHMVKVLATDATKHEDRAALDELHTFSCRFGSAEDSTFIMTIVSAITADYVEAEFKSKWGNSLSLEQGNNLTKLTSLRGQVLSQGKAAILSSQFVHPLDLPLIPRTICFLESELSGGRTMARIFTERYHDNYIHYRPQLEPIRKLLKQMESFNYNTLEFE